MSTDPRKAGGWRKWKSVGLMVLKDEAWPARDASGSRWESEPPARRAIKPPFSAGLCRTLKTVPEAFWCSISTTCSASHVLKSRVNHWNIRLAASRSELRRKSSMVSDINWLGVSRTTFIHLYQRTTFYRDLPSSFFFFCFCICEHLRDLQTSCHDLVSTVLVGN